WSEAFGGVGDDFGRALALNSDGDVIVAGAFAGTMPLSCADGGALTSAGGSVDLFVARFDGSNGKCEWARRYGGGATDDVRGLAVDEDDSIYLSGVYDGLSSL